MVTFPELELLDDEFLSQQRQRLSDERQMRARVVELLQAEVNNLMRRRETGAGPAEGFGTGETESVALEEARDQHARARARMADLDAAFLRLDKGAYGQCEQCGQLIGRDRLEAIPTATCCISCQAMKR
jgi:RNA polymerase-binding transcription factor DksA